jgi:glycosyltransferase involved in cell wall biosynthesis
LPYHAKAIGEEFDLTVVANTQNASLLSDLGISGRLVPVRIERPISVWRDVRALQALLRLFRRENFDLVHSMSPKAGLLAMVAGRIAGIPVRIHTFTGQVWASRTGVSRALLKAMDRVLSSSATFLLVDSHSQREFLVQQRVVQAAKSAVLGKGSVCGVDPEVFRPNSDSRLQVRRSLGMGTDDVVLIFVGRLTQDKGLIDLARAFVTIAQERADVRLLVVGVDEEQVRPAMLQVCDPHKNRVHFVDFTDEPYRFMAAADVLVLPSYREGFGSVVIEGAAVGLPAVGSRIYGLTDAITDGATGLFHQPGDVVELTAKLRELIDDPDLRRHLGRGAMARARQDFSPTALTEELMGVYKRLRWESRSLTPV